MDVHKRNGRDTHVTNQNNDNSWKLDKSKVLSIPQYLSTKTSTRLQKDEAAETLDLREHGWETTRHIRNKIKTTPALFFGLVDKGNQCGFTFYNYAVAGIFFSYPFCSSPSKEPFTITAKRKIMQSNLFVDKVNHAK